MLDSVMQPTAAEVTSLCIAAGVDTDRAVASGLEFAERRQAHLRQLVSPGVQP